MKSLIVYSSLTGNTRSVAEAISEICPEPFSILPVEDAPAGGGDYDFVVLGYWVDKGMPDKKSRDYLTGLNNKKIGLFGTLGAYPDSDHAKDCMTKAEKLAGSNSVAGHFICQGRVDPKLLERMAKMKNNPHPMTEERKKRLEEAKKHPNEEDFAAARTMFGAIFSRVAAEISEH